MVAVEVNMSLACTLVFSVVAGSGSRWGGWRWWMLLRDGEGVRSGWPFGRIKAVRSRLEAYVEYVMEE